MLRLRLLRSNHSFNSLAMSYSRYASAKVLDYCERPLKVLKNGEYIFVPCGKCNGCIIHKANHWSQRVSQEIESTPFSIFFTLTYDNFYLPTLVGQKTLQGDFLYTSDHWNNIRFNGSKDVLRKDHIILRGNYFVPIENDSRQFTVNYASKRDIQLWLKLLHEGLTKEFYGKESFRYYVISEIGPTHGRCHFHGVLFPSSRKVAEYFMDSALYSNWKMCDPVLFKRHTKYCDPGTSCYVSNYSTNVNKLPDLFRSREIRPFRLSSKAPSIGYCCFDKSKVFEDISVGVITYTRTISRIEQAYLLEYPKTYCISLFPKAYEFATLSYSRLLWIYGRIYREVKGYGRSDLRCIRGLRESMHAADYTSTLACFKCCEELGCTPFHYLYLLDMYYYKSAMSALSRWYSWQESMSGSPVQILKSYNNISDYVSNKNSLSDYQLFVIQSFLDGFCIDFNDLDLSFLIDLSSRSPVELQYSDQVSDIVERLQKMPKVNELTGNKPHII